MSDEEGSSVDRAKRGGIMHNHTLKGYCPPQGPADQMHSGPGLGGANYGKGQMRPSPAKPRGSVGLGGENCGPCGTQGKY